jgi:septal ring factor EnvC (AmiA/AmiB activator)
MKAFVLLWIALAESPLERVVTLLSELETEVQNDGASSAEAYKKFACFCQTETDTKHAEITDGEDDVSTLKTEIADLQATRTELNQDIMDLELQLDELDTSMKTMSDLREKEHADFTVSDQDSKIAIEQMGDALGAIGVEDEEEVKFLQTKTSAHHQVAGAPRSSASLLARASTLGAKGDLIGVIGDLKSGFEARKSEVETGEESSQTGFAGAIEAKRGEHDTASAALVTKKGLLVECESDIATKTDDLETAMAELAEDKNYMKELTRECEAKAKEWDQEATMRGNELNAIGQALKILTGDVTTAAAGFSLVAAEKEVQKDAASRAQHSKAAAATGLIQMSRPAQLEAFVDVALVQVGQKRNAPADRASRVVALLERAGRLQHSAALTKVATQVRGGPFAKVTSVIQKLISELVQAAADEAEHKGWCDTQMGQARTDRDFRQASVANLNQDIEKAEARKAELEAREDALTDEIAMVEGVLTDMTNMRADEKKANQDSLEATDQGLTALRQAISLLADFYRTSMNARVDDAPIHMSDSAVQQSLGSSDAAGLGPSGAAYKGNQAGGGGVLSMLKVVEADFKRTADTISKAEAEALRSFTAFKQETEATLSSKRKGLSNTENELSRTTGDLEVHLADLKDVQTARMLAHSFHASESFVIPPPFAHENMDESSRKRHCKPTFLVFVLPRWLLQITTCVNRKTKKQNRRRRSSSTPR